LFLQNRHISSSTRKSSGIFWWNVSSLVQRCVIVLYSVHEFARHSSERMS